MGVERPSVLVVDDQPDREEYVIHEISNGHVDATIMHPADVSVDDLTKADLVLVDYVLEEWDERDELSSPSLQPKDGLALVAVYRAWSKVADSDPPTAFALRSAHLKDLSAPLPPDNREHVIARLYNLEWAFEKTEKGGSAEAIRSLALGVSRLPSDWPLGDSEGVRAQADDLLKLDVESDWYERAWESIQRCHPPLAELSSWSHGLAFLRWVAHRVLPYPTFLLDELHLAARLRATVASVHDSLATAKGESLFKPVQYKGVCDELVGRRWWRAGLETLFWEITDGAPFDVSSLHASLGERGLQLTKLDVHDPVVCLGEDLLPLEELGSSKDAVRLFPDDWPPFADLPWASIDLVLEHEPLRLIVLAPDEDRLHPDLGENQGE